MKSEYFPHCHSTNYLLLEFRKYLENLQPEWNKKLPYRSPLSSKLMNDIFGTKLRYKISIPDAIDGIMAKISGLTPDKFTTLWRTLML